jgi:hypothetical protein
MLALFLAKSQTRPSRGPDATHEPLRSADRPARQVSFLPETDQLDEGPRRVARGAEIDVVSGPVLPVDVRVILPAVET